jgi:hypothetical protein
VYHIEVDRGAGVISAKLAGMMTQAEVALYIADLKRAFVANHLHAYAMVIDVSECPIQLQDIIQTMGMHMATMPKARSLAIVTGSSLARMQIRRLFKQPYARIVATVEEGRAWVYEGVEPTIH